MTDVLGYGVLWWWCCTTPDAPAPGHFAGEFRKALSLLFMPACIILLVVPLSGCVQAEASHWTLFVAMVVVFLSTFKKM